MKKRKKKNSRRIAKGIFPSSLGVVIKNFKKKQEINKIKKIKLEEKEEQKRIVQERKELKSLEDKLLKEEERIRVKNDELKVKEKEINLKNEEQRKKDEYLRSKAVRKMYGIKRFWTRYWQKKENDIFF